MADVDFLGYARAGAAQNPINQFVQGYGMGTQLQGQQARTGLLQEQLQEKQRQEAALKGYAETGDIASAMKIDPLLGLKLTESQFTIANSAAKYWDNTKSGLTRDTYPVWRDDIIKRFPGMSPAQFPDVSTFKTDEDFKNWKYEKEMMAARFKAMTQGPKALAPGGTLVSPTGQELFKAPERPMSAYQQGRLEQGERSLGIREKGVESRVGQRPSFAEFQQDPEIAPLPYAEQVRKFNQAIAGGKAAGQAEKPLTPKQQADAEIAAQKAKLLRKLSGEPEPTTPTPSPVGQQSYQVYDRQTGQMVPVTQEQYDQIKAFEAGQ